MNDNNTQTTVGTMLIVTFGFLLYLAAKLPDINDRRRSTLYTAANYVFFIALLRLIAVTGYMTSEHARIVFGLVSGVFAMSAVDVIFVSPWLYQRMRKEN